MYVTFRTKDEVRHRGGGCFRAEEGHPQNKKKNRFSVIRGFSHPVVGHKKLFMVVTLIMGKAPHLNSLKDMEVVLLSLQGLEGLQLQIIRVLQRPLWGGLHPGCSLRLLVLCRQRVWHHMEQRYS